MTTNPLPARKVCVYCGSSEDTDRVYIEAAYRLGEILAEHSVEILYGGGAIGCMGQLARGALARGGRVIGVIPKFMQELEWGQKGLTQLQVVEDLRERKHLMMAETDAVIALPGGSGTLEELLEALTLKRLGLYMKPIVLVNVRHFFDPLLEMLQRCIAERFMDARHAAIWQVVETPEAVLQALREPLKWDRGAVAYATVRKLL
jgi:uncharacterized protein (TIGR00730 family)